MEDTIRRMKVNGWKMRAERKWEEKKEFNLYMREVKKRKGVYD